MQVSPWIIAAAVVFVLNMVLACLNYLLNRENQDYHKRLTTLAGRYFAAEAENRDLKKRLGM